MGNDTFDREYDLGATTLVRPRGHDFAMFVTPRYRYHYETNDYERFTARLLARVVRRCSLFIDVGANYGFYSFLAATSHPQIEVLALEPVPETAEIFERSRQSLALERVRLRQLAASDADGTAHFLVSQSAENCSFYPHPAAPPLRQVEVQTARVDTLLAGRTPVPTLVKIDVDGHELAVLRGMSGVFATFPDLTLVVEFNPKMQEVAGAKPEDLLLELERLGYAVFLLDDENRLPLRLKPAVDWREYLKPEGCANLYCVRKERALSLVLFSHSSHVRGAEQSLLQLVDELVADYGVLCTAVVPGSGLLIDAMEKAGAGCIPAEYGWWGVLPPHVPGADALHTLMPDFHRVLSGTLPVISKIDPDAIWTQTIVIPWGAAAAGVLGKPHVWSLCEYGELDHGIRFFAPFAEIVDNIKESSALLYAAIKDVGKTLFPDAPPGTWRVLYRHMEIPPTPVQPVSTGLFRREGALRIGVFAALQESKGQEDALRAVGQLVAEGLDIELLLAGDIDPGYWQRLEPIIAEQQLKERVNVPGFLLDRFAAMHETDIVLVSSRCEAFGRVTLEGMLLGKPVIYAAIGGPGEYMVDGHTGLAYRPGDPAGLAAAVRLLLDPARRASLGAQARAYARSRFTAQNYGGEVFRSLLALRDAPCAGVRLPKLLIPLLAPALERMGEEAGQLRRQLQQLQQRASLQAEEIRDLAADLRAQKAENQKLELALAQRAAESVPVRPEPPRQNGGARSFPGVRKFLTKQSRSARKRRAEMRELLSRAAVRLHWSESLREIRRHSKLIRESQLLDENWYRTKYSELVTSRTDPVLHYLRCGAAQGCDPNQLFDTRWYLEQNPDVAAAGVNPLLHYIQAGWKEGRQPNLHFHPHLYLEANPDVAAAGVEPLSHYLSTGIRERRPWHPSGMLDFSREPENTRDWPAPDVRLLAFYLPQFHRIPENDIWWGKGFTEWTNVRRGKPQFASHYQPHVPHPRVGHYDLSNPAVMERQAAMARAFGIYGFCFHHYWFAGKRLLEMPVERMLRTGKPDFPFCLCWANENWTRRWDGMDSEILLAQEHSSEDDELFIRDVARIMRDHRYIRVHGRPLLIIYRPLLLPDPAATFKRWRQVCRAKGLGEIFLIAVQGFGFADPRPLGLDAAVEFPPHGAALPTLTPAQHTGARQFPGQLYDYQQLQLAMQNRRVLDYRLFRGIMPSWDNTARRAEKGTVFVNAGPEDYYLWLSHIVRETRARYKADERIVFINAWNEWAEGCHLEPDQRYGFAWLNATRRALLPPGLRLPPEPVFAEETRHIEKTRLLVLGHDACRAGAQTVLLSLLRAWKRDPGLSFRLVLSNSGPLLRQFESLCPTLVLSHYRDLEIRKAAVAKFLSVRPQLVYANTVVHGPLLDELAWLDCPVVTHVHELQKSIERWAPGETMAATVRRTRHFIAVSEPVAENLKSRHGVVPDAVSVINAFIDTGDEAQPAPAVTARRQELALNGEHIAVFGCGTTDWRKGPDLFVEIAALACAAVPQLRFFWIGAGSREEQRALDKLIARRGLRERVRFLGERSDARACLATGHIFLLPSREDPFPLVALEAADAGLPIVCFEGAGGMPGFVGQECGRVVGFENTNAAAAAIRELATDETLRRRLGAEAKAKVARCHSTSNAAAQIAALLQQVRKTAPTPTVGDAEATPLVSVIVPAYNHARFLAARLDSIRCQNLPNMEILLLDDASDDNSLALLDHFAQTEPRARVLLNGTNSGSTFKQWKKGLAAARGKYIWLAESDDGALPGLLLTLVQKLEANPQLVVAYAQSQMIDEAGRHLGLPLAWTDDISTTRWRSDYVADGRTELLEALSIKNTIPNASAVVFRNFPGIAELVDDAMRLCADWLFWVRLCGRGGVAFHSSPLNYWRQNSSHARTDLPGVLEWKEGQLVVQTAADLLELPAAEKRRLLKAFENRCQTWLGRARAETGEPVPA
jgi:FkbM family methyltransferase